MRRFPTGYLEHRRIDVSGGIEPLISSRSPCQNSPVARKSQNVRRVAVDAIKPPLASISFVKFSRPPNLTVFRVGTFLFFTPSLSLKRNCLENTFSWQVSVAGFQSLKDTFVFNNNELIEN